MPKYGYVVVEGPHDVELVYRLLRPHGLARVQLMTALDPFLATLVPRSFPPGGDLQKRVPVPLFLQSALPDDAGTVSPGPPRLGAFVLPDNVAGGTLEDILLDCARHVYPTLLATATTHVDSASIDTTLVKDDLDELRKPAGRNKAIIGSIASILRPGKAVQVSLQDNRWLRGTALALPRVSAVQAFLMDLLEL